MAVMIVCSPADVHASATAWALSHCGIRTIIWHPAPPWAPPGAVRFGARTVDYRFPGKGGDIAPDSIDAVWMRRWPKPIFPPGFGESDKTASRAELTAYHAGALELLPPDILWANPLTTRHSASFKLRQLAAAVAVGLSIPETLVTDDSAQAKDFVASRPERSVIYKPFYTFHWERADKQYYSSVTTLVATTDFDDPQALIWSPGIFQEFAPKAYELRVSVFGRTCVSAKIFDQNPIDWRIRQHAMKVSPYELPKAIELKLLALMDKLGLVMGMADFIVTPDGDYVFLEINEQGQFLWVEQECPDLPLLDICTRFFMSGDPCFRAETVSSPKLRYADFAKIGLDRLKQERDEFLNAGGVPSAMQLKDYEDDGHAEKSTAARLD